MDHIGMDVHTKESQICTLAEGDKLLDRSSSARASSGHKDDELVG